MKVTKCREAMLKTVLGRMNDVVILYEYFSMSEAAVRRDLCAFASDRRVLRTHGDVTVVGSHEPEAPLGERRSSVREQREAIARLAQAYIADGDTIFLDGGTTTATLARHLSGRQIHVVVNNSVVATSLTTGGIPVTLIGGDVRPSNMSTSGSLAQLSLSRVSVDKALLGAGGVVAINGLCKVSVDQVYLRECVIRQATQATVLTTADKLRRATQQHWTPVERPWTLITDNGASPGQPEPFHERDKVDMEVAPLD